MDDFEKLMSEINGPPIIQRMLIGYDPKTDQPVAQAILTEFDYELFLSYADTKGLDHGILDCMSLKVDINKMIHAGIQMPEVLKTLKCVLKSNIKH